MSLTEEETRRVEEMWRKKREAAKTCKHEGWTFEKHGRCCPHCATFLVDFGD